MSRESKGEDVKVLEKAKSKETKDRHVLGQKTRHQLSCLLGSWDPPSEATRGTRGVPP